MKIYEVADKVDQMKDKLYDKEQALEIARSITKDIKYADTYMNIISKLSTLAEEQGLVLDEYQERKAREKTNQDCHYQRKNARTNYRLTGRF